MIGQGVEQCGARRRLNRWQSMTALRLFGRVVDNFAQPACAQTTSEEYRRATDTRPPDNFPGRMRANRYENLGYTIGKHRQPCLSGLFLEPLTAWLNQSVKICSAATAVLLESVRHSQGRKDRLIDDRPVQALESLRMKVSSLLCCPYMRDSS
jgi:hypothetical protein